jgi:pilus assembly protein CpaC
MNRIAPTAALLLAAAAASPVAAQTSLAPQQTRSAPTMARAGSGLSLEAGSGRIIALGRAATSVFAADPKVVEVRPASPTSLFLFGVAPGKTTVAAIDSSGNPIAQYEVTVGPSSFAANEVAGAIAHQVPGAQVQADARIGGVGVGGTVDTPQQAQRALAAARMNLPTGQRLQSSIGVRQGIEVNLHVRIAEMSRSLTRQLGINWSANGRLGQTVLSGVTGAALGSVSGLSPSVATIAGLGKSSFEAVIDALAQDQLIRSLAEPNLVAMSGEPASFLVGGEYPIPVSQQNNTITVEYKQYGVTLSFVATVLDDRQINLQVTPEVSELTTSGAVTLGGSNSTIQIPALTVRRATTTVNLGSGQSFAIAGLLENTVSHTQNAVPVLGEIPGIGALFRSDSFARTETELVIIVTPYIVGPVSDPSVLQQPDNGYIAPNDFERVVLLRQMGRVGGVDPATSIPGSAGFVMQ